MLKYRREFQSPFVYLVTDRTGKRSDNFFSTIVQAVKGGVSVVQLREKNASFEEFCEIGLNLHNLLKDFKVPLIINDRIDVALAIKADGVHLGQTDVSVIRAREILGKNAIIGLSINSIEDIEKSSGADYVAASPVFSSRTKRDCGEPFGIDSLKRLCAISPYPVVAIGGINLENTAEVIDCGAMGIAVISAIFDAPCPKSAAKDFVTIVEKYDRKKIQNCAYHSRF